MLSVLDELGETETTSAGQLKVLLSDAFITVLAAGEGAGKTHCASRWLCAKMHYDNAKYGTKIVEGKEVAECDLYWVTGVTYQDAYKDWKETKNACERTGILDIDTVHTRDEGNQTCSFKTIYGQLVQTISGSDPENIAREEPHAIVGAEASRWEAELWDRCHGRLERKTENGTGRGDSRGFFSGSFETGRGSFGAFLDWFRRGEGPNDIGVKSFSLAAWDNLTVYKEGFDDPGVRRLQAANSKDRFWERFGGKPAPPRNAVLPEFNTILHTSSDVYYTDHDETFLFIDPGSVVYSVLFVQQKRDLGEIWVVDEIYAHRATDVSMIQEAKSREGWKYAAKTKRIIIDVAGYQQNTTGVSPADAWRDGTHFWVSGKKYPVKNTVDRLRVALGINPITGRARLRIHTRCKGIISEGGGGPAPFKDQGIGGLWTRFAEDGEPRRKNDHSWKALGYGLQGLYGYSLPDGELYTLDEYLGGVGDFDNTYLSPVGAESRWNLV